MNSDSGWKHEKERKFYVKAILLLPPRNPTSPPPPPPPPRGAAAVIIRPPTTLRSFPRSYSSFIPPPSPDSRSEIHTLDVDIISYPVYRVTGNMKTAAEEKKKIRQKQCLNSEPFRQVGCALDTTSEFLTTLRKERTDRRREKTDSGFAFYLSEDSLVGNIRLERSHVFKRSG